MSNIHRLGDYPNDRRSNDRMPMMGGMNNPSGDPRKESFLGFIKDFCCATFVFKSVIFIISVIDVVIYIATLCYGIKLDPNELLAPKTETLDMFGMKVLFILTLESFENATRTGVEIYYLRILTC